MNTLAHEKKAGYVLKRWGSSPLGEGREEDHASALSSFL